MTAALALGEAMGVARGAVAALLPAIEGEMVREINRQVRDQGD